MRHRSCARPGLPPGAVEIARLVVEKRAPAPVLRTARGPYRVQVRDGRRWRDVRVLRKQDEALALAEQLAGEESGEFRVWADHPRTRRRRKDVAR